MRQSLALQVPTSRPRHLLCIGMGFSARAVAVGLPTDQWRVSGSARTSDGVARLAALGIDAFQFDGQQNAHGVGGAGMREQTAGDAARERLATATHLLLSAPPDAGGDPLLATQGADVLASPRLEWVGYLSTIGVYGDYQGAWIDETAEPRPVKTRVHRRIEAERRWRALCDGIGRRLQIFRLGGIYGPGRSGLDKIRDGTAHRIIRPGQVFNRIHVEDIGRIVRAGMDGRGESTTYNLVDDEPAPPQDVVAFAAELLDAPVPAGIDYETAKLSEMARSFYADNKRVRNSKVKADFGLELMYPTYREGLRAIVASSEGA